jgi:hypothetical protein
MSRRTIPSFIGTDTVNDSDLDTDGGVGSCTDNVDWNDWMQMRGRDFVTSRSSGLTLTCTRELGSTWHKRP